jgi:molecular chaperone GrpE
MVKKSKHDSGSGEKETGATPHEEAQISQEPKENLEARLQVKEKEADENYDKYVRALAEWDNYKKRSVKEKSDVLKFGNENLLRDILPMIDNLDRALKHAETSCDFEAFKKGLELLRTQLIASLEKHGLSAIDCLNTSFDPNFHEAMLQVESEVHENNQVIDELEKGYLLHGRLLRPAKVSVCKNKEMKGCA